MKRKKIDSVRSSHKTSGNRDYGTSDSELDDFIDEYRQYLAIDRDGLDEDIQLQAALYHEVSDKLALQVSRRDSAKKHLAEVEAFVDDDIRRTAKRHNDKITEKEISAHVRVDDGVIKANEDLLRLNYGVGRLAALKDSFDQRRYMLREMVNTYTSGYWGEASITSSDYKLKDKNAEDNRRAMDSERKRRVRR